MNETERRLNRTPDQNVALVRWFDACRTRGGLSALVLADELGSVVAGVGEADVDLDAIAARLPDARWSSTMPELRARTMYCEGIPLFVGAVGEGDRAGIELSRAVAGADRILRSAPVHPLAASLELATS